MTHFPAKHVFLSLFVLISSLLSAQSLLFKIEGNGLSQPSYLFGTIHMICASDFFMPDEVSPALDNVKSIYLELDITDTTMMQSMMMKMIDPLMEEYYLGMPTDVIESLNQILNNSMEMGFEQFKMMKPFMLSVLLIQSSINCVEVKSYEEALVEMAADKKLPIRALETLEFQLGLFDSIPLSLQVSMLEEMVLNMGEGVKIFEKMVKAYTLGDLDKLLEIIEKDESMNRFDEIILDDRNADWLEKIPAIIKKSPAFIAVGAGHLPGDRGLLRGLKDMGYVLTPM